MLKKKCSACAKKIEKKFNFCPFCGESFRNSSDAADYGMLGRMDNVNPVQEEMKLPFGMNKIVNSLVKQLERQMGEMNFDEQPQGIPKGFKIKISTGKPQNAGQQIIRKIEEPEIKVVDEFEGLSNKEIKRRESLERVEAISKVRRLADKILYEIDAPGVSKKKDVVIKELASGIEVRVYSKDRCYVKFIPLKVEVIGYSLDKDKVLIELKS